VRNGATENGTPPDGSSGTAAGPVASGSEGSKFITTSSSDWLTTQDNFRWNTGTEIAPVKNITNDPCPTGYRIPTGTELEEEYLKWTSDDAAGAMNSPLKLPLTGSRYGSNGTLNNAGKNGRYWSSTISSGTARHVSFTSSTANMYNNTRAFGYSVRCIKED
jgi:hypothetical protein